MKKKLRYLGHCVSKENVGNGPKNSKQHLKHLKKQLKRMSHPVNMLKNSNHSFAKMEILARQHLQRLTAANEAAQEPSKRLCIREREYGSETVTWRGAVIWSMKMAA